jgi:hypothetical protein
MADLRDFTGKNRKFTGTIGERISTGTTAERDDATFGAGTLRFNTSTNLMEYYTGTEWKSIDAPPTITFITVDGGADTTSGQVDNEASGNVTIEIKGSLFDTTSGNVTFVGTSETLTPDTQTRNNSGLFTVTLPYSSFDDANSPYTVKMTNGSGLSAELVAGISADQDAPVFITSAGSLGTIFDSLRSSYTLSSAAATDADGDTITYSITSGSLPAGLSISSSTGAITGTASAVGSNTTSTFTVSAATAASTSTRQFTITVNAPAITTFTSTGAFTFTVPSGVTSVRALVVAGGGYGGGGTGGGGGAGGVIDVNSFPVAPGTTISGSVGAGQPGGVGFSGNGTDSVFGTLTAKGGGSGGWDNSPNGQAPNPGGSGGGGNGYPPFRANGSGSGIQPSQPGVSGSSGFGFPGTGVPNGENNGGGGGGAAQAGRGFTVGGGNGRSVNITGSAVTYGGGGGGGGPQGGHAGGAGGGGAGDAGGGAGSPGTANTGGGGGGGWNHGNAGGAGGSGIVVISI